MAPPIRGNRLLGGLMNANTVLVVYITSLFRWLICPIQRIKNNRKVNHDKKAANQKGCVSGPWRQL